MKTIAVTKFELYVLRVINNRSRFADTENSRFARNDKSAFNVITPGSAGNPTASIVISTVGRDLITRLSSRSHAFGFQSAEWISDRFDRESRSMIKIA